MSTLPIRASHTAHTWQVPSFARAVAAMLTVIDVFTEAQNKARAAHKQYPFADW
jgi:hypothetical protein